MAIETKKFDIIEIEIASKTINERADPTLITKKIGQKLLNSTNTLEEAEKILKADKLAEEEAYDMGCAMAGSSEFVPTNNNEIVVVEKETDKVYSLEWYQTGKTETIKYDDDSEYEEPEFDFGLIECKGTLEEIYPEGWQF